MLTIHSNFLNFNDSFKYPKVENEIELDEFVNKIISSESEKLNVENLPENAKEDGKYILSEMSDEVKSCLDEFHDNQLKTKFRICVYTKVNDYHDRLWELHDSLEFPDSGYSSSRSLQSSSKFYIFLLLIATLVSWLWVAPSFQILK